MTEDSDSVATPSSGFLSGQGFPAGEEKEEGEEVEEESGYPYRVIEPEPVEHAFDGMPSIPDPPETREELEEAVEEYTKFMLTAYDLNIEFDRLTLDVSARFTRALGKCGAYGDHEARIRISVKHYIDKNYSWDGCKETIRHELAHAWQVRWLGYSSHGPTFRKKANELDCENIDNRYDESEPSYVIICQNCGNSYTRHRECKQVRRPSFRCSVCDEIPRTDNDGLWETYDNTEWHKVMD